MFHLQTETERKLYIEALFHCLDRGTLTARELVEDFNEIILTSGGAATANDRQVQRRIDGVLAAYKNHAVTVEQAAATLLSIFNELATPAGVLEVAGYGPGKVA